MEKKMEYPVTALRVCIDGLNAESGEIEGRVCGVAVEHEYPFKESPELLLLIDRLLDQIGKPQATRIVRSFKEKEAENPSGGYNSNPVRYHDADEIMSVKGKLRTRDIFFVSRSKSTWQGLIKDDQGNMLGRFESDLEFLDLLLYGHNVAKTPYNEIDK